jgi:bacillithiol biosynthesis cysteine-adding enzyme BshC
MIQNALREYETVSAEPSETTAGAGSTALVAVDVRRFGWIRPLAGEYAFNFTHLAPLYAGDPASPEAWRESIARTQQHPRRREQIAHIVAAQQARRDTPPEARASAQLLADSSTVAVITGQQAGAFGGPLFTLLKAVTAIQLARRAARDHGASVVPVFWVDAEDHDWNEVSSCTVIDDTLQPRTITLQPPPGAGELPVAALALDDRIGGSLDELEQGLARTDFTEWVLSSLRAAYRPGAGMGEAFARWLDGLLGPHGLIVFESGDPAAKPLVRDVFMRELQAPGRTASLAAGAGEALAARGHQPQVVPQTGAPALFRLDGARRSIRRDGDQFLVGEDVYSADALAAEAASSPDRFSPNVLLRPVVQDTLFPTICYVAGPSELAYLGQLGEVYKHFGVPMPLMYPRATATILDAAAARFVAKHHLEIEQLQPQDESTLNRLLESQLPASVEQALQSANETVHREMERVIDVLPELDPTLAGAARTTLGKMEHDLKTLHSKVIHAAKRRDETLRRQFTRVQVQAFPLGHPQERTLAVVFFLNRYGPALVERLIQDLPIDMGHHWLVTI